MTAHSPSPEALKAGFDFAQQLKDPAIRQRLKDVGYDGTAGHALVVCSPGEAVADASARDSGRATQTLIVAPEASQPAGWAMVWADSLEASR